MVLKLGFWNDRLLFKCLNQMVHFCRYEEKPWAQHRILNQVTSIICQPQGISITHHLSPVLSLQGMSYASFSVQHDHDFVCGIWAESCRALRIPHKQWSGPSQHINSKALADLPWGWSENLGAAASLTPEPLLQIYQNLQASSLDNFTRSCWILTLNWSFSEDSFHSLSFKTIQTVFCLTSEDWTLIKYWRPPKVWLEF